MLRIIFGVVAALFHCVVLAEEFDLVSPVLTEFRSKPIFNVNRPESPWGVAIGAEDDMSGVMDVSALARGPSGQIILVVFDNSQYPSKKLNGFLTVVSTSIPIYSFLEPGAYTFYQLSMRDARGNGAQYKEAELAALGINTFVVENKRGFDKTPPVFVSGLILTPQMSMSAKHPGTTLPAFLGVSLRISDSGDSALSGVWKAEAKFTKTRIGWPDESFNLYAGDDNGTGRRHRASAELRAGAQVPIDYPPGEYELEFVRIFDFAGNSMFLRSTKFGGETDFGAHFPQTSIVLTP